MSFDRRFVLESGIALAGASLFGAGLVGGGAKKEGQINVITLPCDWAKWGVTTDRFQAL